MELSYLLGPTNPCPTAVHMESSPLHISNQGNNVGDLITRQKSGPPLHSYAVEAPLMARLKF